MTTRPDYVLQKSGDPESGLSTEIVLLHNGHSHVLYTVRTTVDGRKRDHYRTLTYVEVAEGPNPAEEIGYTTQFGMPQQKSFSKGIPDVEAQLEHYHDTWAKKVYDQVLKNSLPMNLHDSEEIAV